MNNKYQNHLHCGFHFIFKKENFHLPYDDPDSLGVEYIPPENIYHPAPEYEAEVGCVSLDVVCAT